MIIGRNRFEDETGSRKTETGNFRHWKFMENFKCSLNHDWESFNFIYYSTQFDDYLWYMILRGKKTKTHWIQSCSHFSNGRNINSFHNFFLTWNCFEKNSNRFYSTLDILLDFFYRGSNLKGLSDDISLNSVRWLFVVPDFASWKQKKTKIQLNTKFLPIFQ